VNSAEGPLYNKSAILYGLNFAREAIREKKSVLLVEGYFDLLACHRVGCPNVVAVSGTALTEQHVKLLKRSTDTAVLCLDQDRAGHDAAERAFQLLAREGFQVQAISITEKDPDEAANAHPDVLRQLLTDGGVPYLDVVLSEIQKGGTASVQSKRAALQRMLPLLDTLVSSVEQGHYIARIATALGSTETAVRDDLKRLPRFSPPAHEQDSSAGEKSDHFSPIEIALGLFLVYPQHRSLLPELIAPEGGFAGALYEALKDAPEQNGSVQALPLPPEHRDRAAILHLFCEVHGFLDWSESLAVREIRKNCQRANHITLKLKQLEIAQLLKEARVDGRSAEEAQLSTQYQQVLKLAKMAG